MAVSPERPHPGGGDGSAAREGTAPVKSQLSSKATAFSIAAIIGNIGEDKSERLATAANTRSGSPGKHI